MIFEQKQQTVTRHNCSYAAEMFVVFGQKGRFCPEKLYLYEL